jgi:type I restriction enzyme S subunit
MNNISQTMIETHIRQRYPSNNLRSVAYSDELIRICNQFVASGLADQKYVTELISGQDSKFWACVSEALLADRLCNKNFLERSIVGEGPDFFIGNENLKIWIEAICPEPTGIPVNWLSCRGSVDVPHVEILLRWTSAIKEKAEKLIGNTDGTTTGYLQKEIVASNEAYVIAVNGCQLRNGPFSALYGISQFPVAAEAVFQIGPIQLMINRETRKVVDQNYQYRPYIINRNNAQVPAYTFLDPRFAPISAIWAVDLNGASVIGNSEPMAVIHNPFALNPIPVGFLPADSEYVATPSGEDEFLLEKIESENISNEYQSNPTDVL